MRFDKIRLKGLGPFSQETVVDIDAAPGLLVAVTGDNGAGKSTLLEMLGGALFRGTQTRGSLKDLATERGAYVEVSCVNGSPWTIRQTMDCVSGKGESTVLDESGAPALETSKVSDFDAWAAGHLPSEQVLYASTLAAQGSEGFLSMKPVDRKDVLTRILGIDHLEGLAKAAREKHRGDRDEYRIMEARCVDLRALGGDVDALTAEVDGAHVLALTAEEELADVRAQAEHGAERDRVAQALREQEATVEQLRTQLRGIDAQLSNADAIRDADLADKALGQSIAMLSTLEAEQTAEERRLRDVRSGHEAQWRREVAFRDRAREAIIDADAVLDDRGRIEGATVALVALQALRVDVVSALSGATAALNELQAARADGVDELLAVATSGLRGVVVSGSLEEAHGLARGSLDDIDGRRRDADAMPAKVQAARAEVDGLAARVSHIDADIDRANAVAVLAHRLEAAERSRADAAAALDSAVAQIEEAVEAGKSVAEEGKRAAEELAGTRAAIGKAREEQRALAPLVAQTDELAAATGRRDALEERMPEAVSKLNELAAALAALPEASATVADVTEVERVLRARRQAVTQAEGALARAQEVSGKLGSLELQRVGLELTMEAWAKLAKDLGRDGLQAVLIDAAGPELTAIVNDLLHSCVGPRWSVAIETTRLSADGKREIEGLHVRVLDTEQGRDAMVETYSGGERVLLGEAVSLGLATMACRSAGLDGVTLVRDESGAALDASNAEAYVAMLRRAADIIGASKVLLVSHSEEVQQLADSRLHVANGRVEVAA